MNRRSFLITTAGAATTLKLARSAPGQVIGTIEDPASLTIQRAAELIRRRQLSPTDLTRACLERIERYNPKLNAFITVTPDLALEQVTAMEAELTAGTHRGPLHGIPIALKDNIDTAGVRTTAGSAVFADRTPTEDAEVTLRLKEAGAVLLGKLNMHEWAAGGGRQFGHQFLGARPQPLEPGPRDGRLLGWLRRGGGRRSVPGSPGYRHRRFCPGSLSSLRHRGPQTQLWKSQ